jgi:hypothetical protein
MNSFVRGFAEVNKLDGISGATLLFSPVRIIVRGRSSAGRALEWHSRGQEFDPPRLQILRLSKAAYNEQPFSLHAKLKMKR